MFAFEHAWTLGPGIYPREPNHGASSGTRKPCKTGYISGLQGEPPLWMQKWFKNNNFKSAHTALAVKACLLGGNSNSKCSMTFVNIAVAISALAGGGQKRFRTETRIRWCFRHFSRIFGCLSARGYWNGILGHFGSFPAMEKRPKMKKMKPTNPECSHVC